MKKCHTLLIALIGIASLASAETNALIEVKLFKNWLIKNECTFGNLAIKNTGEAPILLAKDAFDFDEGQLCFTKERSMRDRLYREVFSRGDGFFPLHAGETHVYEGCKFLFEFPPPFSEEMRFTVSVYLGNGFWLDSEPLNLKGVVPDSEEILATVNNKKRNINDLYKLVAVTYKDERWLYKKSTRSNTYFLVCPLSLTNKIRVEDYDDEEQFKIWDGEKFMIFHLTKSVLTEGPDENNVLGKWTRERKQRAEVDNAEVRRKKAEAEK